MANGEPYYFTATTINPNTGSPYGSDCTSNDPTAGCVFPNALIPKSGWSPVAVNMLSLGLIPQPNAPSNFFNTSAYAKTLRDDKGGVRIDQNTRWGTFFAYYFMDDYLLNDPFPNGGANVPASTFAYNAATAGRAQLINLGNTKNFGTNSVNEFRFSYVRNAIALTTAEGGVGPNYSLASLGFITPWTNPAGGISPIDPTLEGVPYITFNNFFIGVPQVSTRQFNNMFQDAISGNGFLAGVTLSGRALMRQEDGKWWMYGVRPAGIAESGSTIEEAFLRFRQRYKETLFDIARESKDFNQFKAEVERFFYEGDEDEQVWENALRAVRSGKLEPPEPFCKLRRESPESRPSQIGVERLDRRDKHFMSSDNVTDTFAVAQAA